VPGPHPFFKNPAANDPPVSPQGQRAKVAVNAPTNMPHGEHIDTAPGSSAASKVADPAQMARKPKPTGADIEKQKKLAPPAEELEHLVKGS